MTVRGSEESVEARLRSGLLACWCGGTLRPWGCARPRPGATVAGPAGGVPRGGRRRRRGRRAMRRDDEVAAPVTWGRGLAPWLPVLAGNTTLMLMAGVSPS